MSSAAESASVSSAPTVRRAKGVDVAAIMSIGDVYQLADYLPHMLSQFLADDRYFMYVTVVHGRIVTFRVFHVPPGDKTVNMMAGRMHPDFRGQSHMKALTAHALKEICLCHPDVERTTRDAFYSRYWKENLQRKIDESGLALHRVWKVFIYYCERPVVESLPLALLKMTGELHTPTRLSDTEMRRLLDTTDDIDALLGRDGDYYVCWSNWMVLPVTKAGIRMGLESCSVYITPGGPHCPATALSLATCVPIREHARADIYFYGGEVALFLGHLRAQVDALLEGAEWDRCVLEVHFPVGLDAEHLEKTLGCLLGEKYYYMPPEQVDDCIVVSEPINKAAMFT